MSRHGERRWREASTLVVTTLVALWYAAIVIGVPLPTPRRLFSERFPCENCHCGCDSADRCWSDCCCHTAAERLEWAKREGVTPPASAMKALASIKSLPPCCAKRAATREVKPPCCEDGPRSYCASEGRPASSADYVLGWKALKCRGAGLQWTSAVPAVPVGAWRMPALPVCVEWVVSIGQPRPPSVADAPAVPPPER